MAGSKKTVFAHMLGLWEAVTPVLCVDSDEPDQTFIERLKLANNSLRTRSSVFSHKDWNSKLLDLQDRKTMLLGNEAYNVTTKSSSILVLQPYVIDKLNSFQLKLHF